VGLAPAAALFRSLGDPAWLMIVRRLAGGPARVTDLVAAPALAQSTVSKHLACLQVRTAPAAYGWLADASSGLERRSLCRPSGPDGEGQAEGQARNARGEPPSSTCRKDGTN
jgi:hypothetical protein